jgi:hypothetical protein
VSAVTWQWMRHRDHGGANRFPSTVLDQMASLGWEPCDEPPEPDDAPISVPAPAELEQSPSEPSVGQPPASPSRARRASNQEQ